MDMRKEEKFAILCTFAYGGYFFYIINTPLSHVMIRRVEHNYSNVAKFENSSYPREQIDRTWEKFVEWRDNGKQNIPIQCKGCENIFKCLTFYGQGISLALNRDIPFSIKESVVGEDSEWLLK